MKLSVSCKLKYYMQRRAARLELIKDDPYYLVDDRPRSAPPRQEIPEEDVESIPVVKLDSLDGMSPCIPIKGTCH
jgi:AP-3 complex subunit delta